MDSAADAPDAPDTPDTPDTADAVRESLAPTWFLDADHPDVVSFATRTVAAVGATGPRERAVALFHAVRDGWRYDPYAISRDPHDYRASAVLARSSAYCIPKSVLLTTLCRAVGVPARLGFADVRNHLQSEKLQARMGTDLFVFHGYSEILLDGHWRKVSAAFNADLCTRFGTRVLEFDGTGDALLHPYDAGGNRHMEYVAQRGSFTDLPLGLILAAFDDVYGPALTGGGGGVGDEAFAPPR